jgi:extracellular factor (EF) 3-hydroxypalmitic acid methyl ester biosynthesis protein
MSLEANLAVFPNTELIVPRARRQRRTEEHDALALLRDLETSDVEWILSKSVEQHILASAILFVEGQVPDSIYFVLEGVLETWEGTIGRGEIVGEMSFLENKPAVATVRACEDTLLLVLGRKDLDAKTAADSAFAARLYRSFARLLSRELRTAQSATDRARAVPTHGKDVTAQLESMKLLLAEADHQAIRNDDQMPEAVLSDLREHFRSFCDTLNADLGDASSTPPALRQELGAKIQRELLPYILLTKNGERFYSKPRGYAGDFLSIEGIYQDTAEGCGRLGPVIDRCFLDQPAAQAVRNRRGLLTEEIKKSMAEPHTGPTRVLSMACGPAREIFDTFETMSEPNQLKATCLDFDLQALAFVSDLRDRRRLKGNIRLENANLVNLVLGRQKIELQPLDLAYSIGLIDYFNDDFVVKLLDFTYDHLRPGGRIILGNFHTRNPTKAFMDHVLEWKLIHRDEATMNRLFRRSKFQTSCEEIRYEDEGINMFAIGRRAASPA